MGEFKDPYELAYAALFHDIEKVFRVRLYGGSMITLRKDRIKENFSEEIARFLSAVTLDRDKVKEGNLDENERKCQELKKKLKKKFRTGSNDIKTIEIVECSKILELSEEEVRKLFLLYGIGQEVLDGLEGEFKNEVYDGPVASLTRIRRVESKKMLTLKREGKEFALATYISPQSLRTFERGKLLHIYPTGVSKYNVEVIGKSKTIKSKPLEFAITDEYFEFVDPKNFKAYNYYGPFYVTYLYSLLYNNYEKLKGDISVKAYRSNFAIPRAEDIAFPTVPLSIHVLLGSAIALAYVAKYGLEKPDIRGKKIRIYHVFFKGYKDIVSGLPYTFDKHETGYLKTLRAIEVTLYALNRALARAIREAYVERGKGLKDVEGVGDLFDYFALIRSPTDLIFFAFENIDDLVMGILNKLEKALSRPIEFKSPKRNETRPRTLLLYPMLVGRIANGRISRELELYKDKNKIVPSFKKEKIEGFYAQSPTDSDDSYEVAVPKSINLDLIGKKTRGFLVSAYKDGRTIYPLVRALVDKGYEIVLEPLYEFENFKYPEKLDDAAIVLEMLEYLDDLEARFEELIEIITMIRNKVPIKGKKAKKLGKFDAFFLPLSKNEDLNEIFGKERVLYWRIILPEPSFSHIKLKNILEELSEHLGDTIIDYTTPLHYVSFLEENYTLRFNLWIPNYLKRSFDKLFIVYSTRDETYYITAAKPKSSVIAELLKARSEVEFPVEIILETGRVKRPLYFVKANTDPFIGLNFYNDYKPMAIAFSMPIKLEDLADAIIFSGRIDASGALLNYIKILSRRFVLPSGKEVAEKGFFNYLVDSIVKKEAEIEESLLEEFVKEALYVLTRISNTLFEIDNTLAEEIIKETLSAARGLLENEEYNILDILRRDKVAHRKLKLLVDAIPKPHKNDAEKYLEIIAILTSIDPKIIREFSRSDNINYKLERLRLLALIAIVERIIKELNKAEILEEVEPKKPGYDLLRPRVKLAVAVRLSEISEEKGE